MKSPAQMCLKGSFLEFQSATRPSWQPGSRPTKNDGKKMGDKNSTSKTLVIKTPSLGTDCCGELWLKHGCKFYRKMIIKFGDIWGHPIFSLNLFEATFTLQLTNFLESQENLAVCLDLAYCNHLASLAESSCVPLHSSNPCSTVSNTAAMGTKYILKKKHPT